MAQPEFYRIQGNEKKSPKRLEKLEIYEVYAHFQGHTFHGHPLQYGLDILLIALLSSIQHLSIYSILATYCRMGHGYQSECFISRVTLHAFDL